jgi:6-pyruvoyl-tetrahydropterin synthase
MNWPKARKECLYIVKASHHLDGISKHPDAADIHEHNWFITLIFNHWEFNPWHGFTRDEADIDASFGERIRQLQGKLLNDLMPVPPTSENLAIWLIAEWMQYLSPNKINFELDAVRVSKCAMHTTEATKEQVAKWKAAIARQAR